MRSTSNLALLLTVSLTLAACGQVATPTDKVTSGSSAAQIAAIKAMQLTGAHTNWSGGNAVSSNHTLQVQQISDFTESAKAYTYENGVYLPGYAQVAANRAYAAAQGKRDRFLRNVNHGAACYDL